MIEGSPDGVAAFVCARCWDVLKRESERRGDIAAGVWKACNSLGDVCKKPR